MHSSSFSKVASFLRAYSNQFPHTEGRSRLLEIGSKAYHGQRSYRELIDESRIDYCGLDLEDGPNVDIVASAGLVWPDIADESFDLCISGQTFEHNPFFWATMAEISRVLSPGGFTCIIAPASQAVHRYPLDCWRFYPDSWAALCALVGLEVVEVYVETDQMALNIIDGHVRDSMVIAQRPKTREAAIHERLRALTIPFRDGGIAFEPVPSREGPCIEDYRRTVPRTSNLRAKIAYAFHSGGPSCVLP